MRREELQERLDGGLFISSMMGVTDGRWVADRAAHTRMVQIGALLADAQDRSHDPSCLLPVEESDMVPMLERQLQPVRERWAELPVCLNGAPGDLESALRMARAFAKAGGDLYELNCHGGYAKLLERGLLRNMVLPENRATMRAWLLELCRLPIPVVVKFDGTMEGFDFLPVLETVSDITGLFGVHFNIRDSAGKQPNQSLVRQVRPHVGGMLWCSGYVRSADQVAELRAAGVDCIGIAQGLRDDPAIFNRLGRAGG
jgi:tRNA-dihydrouridine synthase